MSGLVIYMSNRLERLAQELARVVAKPKDHPLAQEIIMVHGKGMERWISMELARLNGICANTVFPFPNAWVRALVKAVIPGAPETPLFETRFMTFKIMAVLPLFLDQGVFGEIRQYLADGDDELKRYQLAAKIAHTFDQYLTFRPELITEWENGGENHWQARLWREVSRDATHMHRAGLQKALVKGLSSQSPSGHALPKRLSVFGTSYLAPFHLEILAELARYLEIHMFVMNPCREFWSDIMTDREMRKTRFRSGGEVLETDLYMEQGNPLLSSLGSMARAFFSSVSDVAGETRELFEAPEICPADILGAVQWDILNLKDRTAEKDQGRSFSPIDSSGISIHNCHSPMREIEVLYDQLLAMFEEDPRLLPGDILVMTPDIDAYALFIRAVLEGRTDEKLKIPFSIADQRSGKDQPLVRGVFSVLDLADSRLTAAQIMGILEQTGIMEKFGITEWDMPMIEKWVQDVNIRWGVDESHRAMLGLPGRMENTWKAGIERMLLGYAMPGHNRRMFSGILPYDLIEGGDSEVLGRFLDYLHRIFDLAEVLNVNRTPEEWSVVLKQILTDFFVDDEKTEGERQLLLNAFDGLAAVSDVSGFKEKIGIRVIRADLDQSLEDHAPSGGFVAGGVTFCAMLPLRSIPAKVICLIGMNGDAFPRDYHPPGFDWVAKHPRPGDRIRRQDDKYLFLQALLSARKKFYISFVGQSNRDNSRIPPSVVVSDLTDYLTTGFGIREEDVTVIHPLQPFSEAYFKEDPRLFSYSVEDFNACRTGHEREFRGIHLSPFISEPLCSPAPEFKGVDLDDLCYFFANPARFFLQRRLSVFLQDELPGFEDDEAFVLGGLDRYRVEQDLVGKTYEEMEYEEKFMIQRAMGRLPHGRVGEALFPDIHRESRRFIERARSFEKGHAPEQREVDLKIDDFNLTGSLGPIHGDTLVQTAYVKTGPGYLLNAWIRHLAMSALSSGPKGRHTVLLLKDASWSFLPLGEGENILSFLLSLYWRGLMEPLVFFPRSSIVYAENRHTRGKTEFEALNSAKKEWAGNAYLPGEEQDPYYHLCFSRIGLDEIFRAGVFQETAKAVFLPLLENRHKTETPTEMKIR
jgi:exodeoxyribonuclease V gamma subunit